MADIDEFAQTRGADDLFDDEIIPVSAEEQQAQTEAVIAKPEPEPEPESVPAPVASPSKEVSPVENQPSPRGDTAPRGRGGERGRGRGRGRGKGGRGGLQDSIFADPKRAESPRSKSKGRPKAPEPEGDQEAETAIPEAPQDGPKEQPGLEEEDKGEVLIANGAEPQRVPAVRGDRSATGGVRKVRALLGSMAARGWMWTNPSQPKLTEEELSKRIAAAKENAAKKAAAHARAEADQASFLEREQIAAKKRRQELANRRVMDNEREQNRQRKLNAQTGREWDSEKREEDYNLRGGGSQFRRGMHGGVSGYVRRDFDNGRSSDAVSDHGSRGRGRGGRGGRGRGSRGERASSRDLSETTDAKTTAPSVHDEASFPSLPATKKPEPGPAAAPVTTAAPPTMEKLESTMSPVSGTWADQVEE
ncbi:uncharacterized protein N7459_001174 [Penicillium hispanicum]|uniref:uncharacterized protein n=1 Tax=Penicillium hispanicum TaxID=1080232 RepID=UPI00254025FE|nr:uncharacterized protein N7459_001174 [Penicillium hispanicum]KAJ5594966.1 hypothetical protein N7459_001174 [Penicillium hispanicum]